MEKNNQDDSGIRCSICFFEKIKGGYPFFKNTYRPTPFCAQMPVQTPDHCPLFKQVVEELPSKPDHVTEEQYWLGIELWANEFYFTDSEKLSLNFTGNSRITFGGWSADGKKFYIRNIIEDAWRGYPLSNEIGEERWYCPKCRRMVGKEEITKVSLWEEHKFVYRRALYKCPTCHRRYFSRSKHKHGGVAQEMEKITFEMHRLWPFKTGCASGVCPICSKGAMDPKHPGYCSKECHNAMKKIYKDIARAEEALP
jgi:hypothetical protein